MRYEITDLEILIAVAEEENVTRGAARCNLAPSSASIRLKNLEESLGTRLLDRNARGVSITPAGFIAVEHAKRCIAQLEQMHADLMPFAKGVIGHITLFGNNNAIASHLPDDLARFFSLYPNVRITLEERTSHEIVAAVIAGRADVGVVALEDTHPDLEYIRYRKDELVLLVPLIDQLASAKAVRFTVCLGRPFISLQTGTALHTFLMNHATNAGGKLDVRVQVSGYRSIARLVSSGAGIGVVPRSALEKSDTKHLAVISLTEAWAQRDLRVCISKDTRSMNPFRDRLVETLCKRA